MKTLYNLLYMATKTKLGEDIVKTYERYINTASKWKVTNVSTQKFEIDERYEVIETSNSSLTQSGREHMPWLSPLRITMLPTRIRAWWPSRRSTRLSSTKYSPKEPSGSSGC